MERFAFIAKMKVALDALQRRGISPWLGIIVPGSGIAIGAEVRKPRFGSLHIGGEVDGKISWHNFRELGMRIGYVERRKSLIELRSSDAVLSRMFDDVRPEASGVAVYFEQRYRSSPGLSLFGTDANGQFRRADFGVSGSTSDAVVQWQPTGTLGFSARAGTLSFNLSPGNDPSFVNVEDSFVGDFLSDERHKARYGVAGFGAMLDHRDIHGAPTRGTVLAGIVWRYESRTGGLPSFTRLTVDARGYRSLMNERHVLAVRLLASADVGTDSTAPFYMLPWFGGGVTMRGFESYRLRGSRIVTSSVEYRWRAAKFLEVAPFVDVARIGGSPVVVATTGLIATPGIGLRVRSDQRVWLRLDVAHSTIGWHFALGTSAAF